MTETFKIFVSNIPYDCTKDDIDKLFANIEGYVCFDLTVRPNTNISRGFGCMTVNSKNAYDSILTSLTASIHIKDRILQFAPYNPIKKTYSVHIKFIPQEFSESMLANVLSKYGKVTKCLFDLDNKTKTPKGTAVADFDDIISFKKIITEKNIKFDYTRTIEVTKRLRKQFNRFLLPPAGIYPRYYNMYQGQNTRLVQPIFYPQYYNYEHFVAPRQNVHR